MQPHVPASLVRVLLVLLGRADLRSLFPVPEPNPPTAKETPAKPPRPLRPRTPEDCPACRAATNAPSPAPTAAAPIRPWCEVKSHRGAPKRINTKGFACPNPDCKYCGVTDSRLHALVGYGHHGQAEPIKDLYCQACHHKFTVYRTRHSIGSRPPPRGWL